MAEPMTEEEYLHLQIKRLQEQYQRQAQPYLDRLAQIHSRRIDPVLVAALSLPQEFLDSLGKAPDAAVPSMPSPSSVVTFKA